MAAHFFLPLLFLGPYFFTARVFLVKISINDDSDFIFFIDVKTKGQKPDFITFIDLDY